MAMAVPVDDVLQLRSQGLTDNLIVEELKGRGYNQPQINSALAQADAGSEPEISGLDEFPAPSNANARQGYSGYSQPQMPARPSAPASDEEGNIYERIEEIAESMIDEKWDELISEVKKIIEWKEKIEDKQTQIINDLEKLKEDFTVLHQGVLGKLEDYDSRMMEVGTELKAVGKVFKEVVPQFVENVKELKDVTGKMRK